MNKTEIEAKLVGLIQTELNQSVFTASEVRGGRVISWATIRGREMNLSVRDHKTRGFRIRVRWNKGCDHSYFSRKGKNLDKTAKKIVWAVSTNNGWDCIGR